MKNIVVIDDFYQNPASVRAYALSQVDYVAPETLSADFPGTESRHSFYSQALIGKMERAIGQKIQAEPKKFSFGVFAKTYASDQRRKAVHVDGSEWTAVVYLSRAEDCRGGTVFYREKETGLDALPNQARIKEMGYLNKEDFIGRFIKPRAKDESAWQVSARIGIRFNRMVLFRAGQLYHAAEGYFGTTDENCRLIQLFFFKTAGGL